MEPQKDLISDTWDAGEINDKWAKKKLIAVLLYYAAGIFLGISIGSHNTLWLTPSWIMIAIYLFVDKKIPLVGEKK